MSTFSHLNAQGETHMVDIGEKLPSKRRAVAYSQVKMDANALDMIDEQKHKKGDVIAVARIAGIQAAKKCADLIPLCHPLMLNHIAIDITLNKQKSRVEIQASCEMEGKTGVEMEALTACSIAALTIYDMCKSVDKNMRIKTRLLEKVGGTSTPCDNTTK